VYHGSAAGLSALPDWTAEGDQTEARFGYSLGSAGDVNGDGYGDVIIGAKWHDKGSTNEGRAYVYLGSAGGLQLSPAWTAEGDQVGAEFGEAVTGAGDVNGDGFGDVLVGAHAFDGTLTAEGRAYAYYGSASGLSSAASWVADGGQAGATFGTAVGDAGDVNGDGYGDVLVGATAYDGDQTDEGAAFLFLGSEAGLAAIAAWTAEGDQAGSAFGWTVGSAGDIDGDGLGDALVSARYYDDVSADEGALFLYRGAGTGLEAGPFWSITGRQAGAELGISATTSGDLNGNGAPGVIVGAWLYDRGETDEGIARIYFEPGRRP
jgi:hypothetical protein